MMVNPDVDGYTTAYLRYYSKTLNHRKILRKTQNTTTY